MSKQLIAPGVYMYSLDSLEEAKRDAYDYANDTKKTFRKNKSTRHVLTNGKEYYGPVTDSWKEDIVWRSLTCVHTEKPKEE